MTILSVDLSMSASGWVMLPGHQIQGADIDSLPRGTIRTPSRSTVKGEKETDYQWSRRRHRVFSEGMATLLNTYRPTILALETSPVVFARKEARGRYGPGAQYRAGIGLGRALGWIDSILELSSAYGYSPQDVVTVTMHEAKLRIAGNRTAGKDTVRAKIRESFSCTLSNETWDEAEVDALAVGLAYQINHGSLLFPIL